MHCGILEDQQILPFTKKNVSGNYSFSRLIHKLLTKVPAFVVTCSSFIKSCVFLFLHMVKYNLFRDQSSGGGIIQ